MSTLSIYPLRGKPEGSRPGEVLAGVVARLVGEPVTLLGVDDLLPARAPDDGGVDGVSGDNGVLHR